MPLVGRRADRDVIALDAVELQHLLYRDADRRPAAPDADQERRPEAAAHDLHPSASRVPQQESAEI